MGDNKNRYDAVRKALKKFYPDSPAGNVARHLDTLAALISGIVGSRSTQLPKIAEKVPDGTKETSREKKYARFVGNDKISEDTYFFPFARLLLRNLGLAEIVMAIDTSAIGRDCAILIVSVIYKKRALPIAWIVSEGGKGHFSEQEHIRLIRKVGSMIPKSAGRVILLGDGEFDGVGFQKELADMEWYYVCRTCVSISIFIDKSKFHVCDIGFMIIPGFYRQVGNVMFTNKRYGPVNVMVYWEDGHVAPIYLVTNMESADDTIRYYSKRFRIETFFSDQKSRGFGIGKSHISDPVRLSRLMIAACLAYIWMIFMGTMAVSQGWDKIIHRTDRCDLSLFRLGLKLLNHFLNHDISIPVCFQISEF